MKDKTEDSIGVQACHNEENMKAEGFSRDELKNARLALEERFKYFKEKLAGQFGAENMERVIFGLANWQNLREFMQWIDSQVFISQLYTNQLVKTPEVKEISLF